MLLGVLVSVLVLVLFLEFLAGLENLDLWRRERTLAEKWAF